MTNLNFDLAHWLLLLALPLWDTLVRGLVVVVRGAVDVARCWWMHKQEDAR